MPWSGSAGSQTFARTDGIRTGATVHQQAEAAGEGIRADRMDTHGQDLATGIGASLQHSGGNSLSGDIPAAGHGFTGLGTWSSATEATITAAATTDVLASTSLQVLATGSGATITSLGSTAKVARKRVRFDGINTLSHSSALICPGAANITTASGDVMEVESDASGNTRITNFQRAATAPAPTASSFAALPGFIHGLTLSNDSGDLNNDIGIAAGYGADASGNIMTLGSALVKQLDSAWTVGTNQGMRDTGSISNAWWYIFLIQRSDTGVVDVLASLSATSPTMPTNYDRKRRIGAIFRTAGAIKGFKQVDDRFIWGAPVNDVNTSSPGTSAVTPSLTLPSIAVTADISVLLSDATPAVSTSLLLTSPSQVDVVPTTLLFSLSIANSGAGVPIYTSAQFLVDTSNATVRYRLNTSTADHAVEITTNGWWDSRGRLS